MAISYVIPLGFFGLSSPADSTTYFAGFGGSAMTGASDTWAENHHEIVVAGTIVAVSYTFKNIGTLGSTENVTTAIRLNDTTDIASVADARFDVAFETLAVTGLSQAVVAGDKIAFKILTPAWNPNPTNVIASAVVYLE